MEKILVVDRPATGTKCPVCNKNIVVSNVLNIDVMDKLNQHDTLQAKADLFDEMYPILDAIEKAYRSHEIRGETVNGNKLLSLAHEILSEAKEPKCTNPKN